MAATSKVLRFSFFSLTFSASAVYAGRGQWTSVGFRGSYVGPVAYAPSDPNTAVAVVLSGSAQLFRTTDGSRTWSPLPFPESLSLPDGVPRLLSVNDLAIDPENSLLLYAAVGIFPLAPQPAPPPRGALLKSIDGGESWEQASEIVGGPATQVLVDPAHPATLYLAYFGDDGFDFRRSDDFGASWVSIRSALPAGVAFSAVLAMDPGYSQRLYAALDLQTGPASHKSEAFRSDDGGRNWAGPLPLLGGLSVGSDSTVYASNGSSVWRSFDFGVEWILGGAGLPADAEVVVPDPLAPERLFIGSIDHGVFVSRDRGASWDPFIDAGLPPAHHGLSLISPGYSLSIAPNGSFLIAPSFQGLFELSLTMIEPVRPPGFRRSFSDPSPSPGSRTPSRSSCPGLEGPKGPSLFVPVRTPGTFPGARVGLPSSFGTLPFGPSDRRSLISQTRAGPCPS